MQYSYDNFMLINILKCFVVNTKALVNDKLFFFENFLYIFQKFGFHRNFIFYATNIKHFS